MATVTTDAITPTTLPIAAPSHVRTPSATCWRSAPTTDGSARASSCERSSATPDWIDRTISTTLGMKASAMTSRTITPIRKNRRVARAEDFVFDHPRARSLPTSGANDAATTSESRTETVTVPSRTASQIVTAARPAIASRRQLSAPRRRNHPGMTTVSAGTDVVTTLLRRTGQGGSSLPRDRRSRPSRPARRQDRPGLYLPAARASACSLMIANSSGVMDPAAWSLPAFSISSAAESRV